MGEGGAESERHGGRWEEEEGREEGAGGRAGRTSWPWASSLVVVVVVVVVVVWGGGRVGGATWA